MAVGRAMDQQLRAAVFAGRGIRAFCVGILAVAVPLALEGKGFSTTEINAVVSAGMAGASVQMQFSVVLSRLLGRGGALALFTAGMAAATGVLSVSRSFHLAFLASFLGAMSMQPNISSQMPHEKTVIAYSSQGQDDKKYAFAWYNSISTVGLAAGAFAAGLGAPGGPAMQMLAACALLLVAVAGYVVSSRPIPAPKLLGDPLLEPEKEDLHIWQCRHRSRIMGLAALFSVDSFAGGLVMNPVLIHWLSTQFMAEEGMLGTLFGTMGLITVPSLWVAAWLGKKIGLINTMVFTHLPSNVCLILMTMTPDVRLVYLLLMLRASTSQMDVPTRDRFIMTAVDEEERVACSAIIDTARALGAVVGPPAAALLWEGCSPGTPLVVAGLLKCVYDLTLLATFRAMPPASA